MWVVLISSAIGWPPPPPPPPSPIPHSQSFSTLTYLGATVFCLFLCDYFDGYLDSVAMEAITTGHQLYWTELATYNGSFGDGGRLASVVCHLDSLSLSGWSNNPSLYLIKPNNFTVIVRVVWCNLEFWLWNATTFGGKDGTGRNSISIQSSCNRIWCMGQW